MSAIRSIAFDSDSISVFTSSYRFFTYVKQASVTATILPFETVEENSNEPFYFINNTIAPASRADFSEFYFDGNLMTLRFSNQTFQDGLLVRDMRKS